MHGFGGIPARTLAMVMSGIVGLAIVVALTPVLIKHVRVTAAGKAMAEIRTRMVSAERFVGFDNGALRPTAGTDYLVLGDAQSGQQAEPLKDPWGNPYRVRYLLDRKSYLLQSAGPDGEEGPCEGEEPQADDLCLMLAAR